LWHSGLKSRAMSSTSSRVYCASMAGPSSSVILELAASEAVQEKEVKRRRINIETDKIRGLRMDYPVSQVADAFYLYFNYIPGFDSADAGRRAGGDDVAGQQGHNA